MDSGEKDICAFQNEAATVNQEWNNINGAIPSTCTEDSAVQIRGVFSLPVHMFIHSLFGILLLSQSLL